MTYGISVCSYIRKGREIVRPHTWSRNGPWTDREEQKSCNDLHTVHHMDSVQLPASNYPRDPWPLRLFWKAYPTGIPTWWSTCNHRSYTFDSTFRFTIQVTHGLVDHGVEGLLIIPRGATIVHTAKEGTEPFMMSRFIICVCLQFGILQIHLTPRPCVLVSDTGDLFAVRDPSHRLVWVVSHTSVTIGWNPCNGILFQVRSAKHVHTSTYNYTTAEGRNETLNFMQPDFTKPCQP